MIEVEGLRARVGTFALEVERLEIPAGEYFVLMGPTGAGKTLFLKCLCGLIRVRGGTIRLDGEDITHLPPWRRRIGYVPQDYGLFPHLTVEENILFGLKAGRLSRKEAMERAKPIIEMLQLEPLLHRSPLTLSGGERQKVALARALTTQPKALLLDEPVSALDEPTRERVCAELRRIQRELGLTTIHVCHNVEEAMAVSDRVGILEGGKLLQTGPMTELLQRPRNESVARLLRAENILSGKAQPLPDGGSLLLLAGHRLRISRRCEGEVKFTVRPEALRVLPLDRPAENALRARLRQVTDKGLFKRLEFWAGFPLVVYLANEEATGKIEVGKEYWVAFPPDAVHILE